MIPVLDWTENPRRMSDENQELRKVGLKVTLPRVKILQILESTERGGQHMSAEAVYQALRDWLCGRPSPTARVDG